MCQWSRGYDEQTELVKKYLNSNTFGLALEEAYADE